jgi:hypothetical protein
VFSPVFNCDDKILVLDGVSSSNAPEATTSNIEFIIGGIAYAMAIGYSID